MGTVGVRVLALSTLLTVVCFLNGESQHLHILSIDHEMLLLEYFEIVFMVSLST